MTKIAHTTTARRERASTSTASPPLLAPSTRAALAGIAGERPDLAEELRHIESRLATLEDALWRSDASHSGPCVREVERVRFAAARAVEFRAATGPVAARRLRDAVTIMAWVVDRADDCLRAEDAVDDATGRAGHGPREPLIRCGDGPPGRAA